jgi:ribosomal protein L34E
MDCTDTELLLEVQRRLLAHEKAAKTPAQRRRLHRLHKKAEALLPLCADCGIDVQPLSGGTPKPPRD